MLKITYLESEIYLEYLDKSIEVWQADRILVNLRAGVSIYVESSIASLVLPITSSLNSLIKLAENQSIEIVPCDEKYLEVSLLGTWVAQESTSEEGVFVCELNPEIEYCLYRLWQESQVGTSITVQD
ncbi:MAG: alr0857 family protein [Cyanobacteria bacterium P01_C01_bin.72]